MKRVLLSFCLIGAAIFGHAQVILNELYTDPGSGNSEFFELYNTSTNNVPLDCYTLVTLYSIKVSNKVTYTGAYVLDFPSINIKPKSWIVGAATDPFNVQKQTGVKPDFNWNNLAGTTGSLKKYQLNTTNTDSVSLVNASFIDVTTNSDPNIGLPSSLADLLFNTNGALGGGVYYEFFLFNSGNYVNGFLGKSNSTAIPSILAKLKPLTYATNCGGVTGSLALNWSSLKSAEYQNLPASTDNGYARASDGACGSWVKTASPKSGSVYTPDASNGSATGSTVGFLTTNQAIVCNNKLYFQITATTDQSALPVSVQLYQDYNSNATLDASDILLDSKQVLSTSTSTYSFDLPDPSQKYLIVYSTQLGCIDKVAVPTIATGALTTTERNICGNQVDFAVTGVTGDAGTYGLPVQVQLYEDYGTAGTLDPGVDVAIGSAVPVSTTSNTRYSITIPDASKGKSYILVYTSSNSCFNKTVVPTAAQISLTTTQKNICGNYVEVSASAATLTSSTLDPTIYVVPMIAELHWDANNNNTYDPSDPDEAVVLATQSITSLSATKYSIAIPADHKNDNIIVVYKTAQDCFSKSALATPLSGALTTTETNICNKRIDFSITGGTGDALTYALPITVELRNAADNTLLNSTTVSNFSANVLSLSVPDPSKSVALVYKPAASCLGKSATPVSTTAALQVGGLIPLADVNVDGTRTVTYFVVGTATDAAAFPLELKLYEDVNKDGIVNTGDKLVGQQSINSVSQGLSYTAKITNPNSLAIVTAASVPSGCAQANLPLSNTNAPVTILPVHFATFSAMRNNSNKSVVNLKWSTATEQNNRGFNVQRNTGSGWKTIAFVFSLADDGNSNALLSYEYKDANSEKGITQYRIQQVDMDGKASFSDVRSVTGIEKAGKMIVYPNPSNNGKVNVLFENPSVRTVVVSDVAGRIVKEYNNVTSNTLEIAPLARGFYSIKVNDLKSGVIAVEKVIIK